MFASRHEQFNDSNAYNEKYLEKEDKCERLGVENDEKNDKIVLISFRG